MNENGTGLFLNFQNLRQRLKVLIFIFFRFPQHEEMRIVKTFVFEQIEDKDELRTKETV